MSVLSPEGCHKMLKQHRSKMVEVLQLTSNLLYFLFKIIIDILSKDKITYLLKSPCSDPPSWVSFSRHCALLDVSSLAAVSKSAGTFHNAAWSSAFESLAVKKIENVIRNRNQIVSVYETEICRSPTPIEWFVKKFQMNYTHEIFWIQNLSGLFHEILLLLYTVPTIFLSVGEELMCQISPSLCRNTFLLIRLFSSSKSIKCTWNICYSLFKKK